jgi:hypothetical protein
MYEQEAKKDAYVLPRHYLIQETLPEREYSMIEKVKLSLLRLQRGVSGN